MPLGWPPTSRAARPAPRRSAGPAGCSPSWARCRPRRRRPTSTSGSSSPPCAIADRRHEHRSWLANLRTQVFRRGRPHDRHPRGDHRDVAVLGGAFVLAAGLITQVALGPGPRANSAAGDDADACADARDHGRAHDTAAGGDVEAHPGPDRDSGGDAPPTPAPTPAPTATPAPTEPRALADVHRGAIAVAQRDRGTHPHAKPPPRSRRRSRGGPPPPSASPSPTLSQAPSEAPPTTSP